MSSKHKKAGAAGPGSSRQLRRDATRLSRAWIVRAGIAGILLIGVALVVTFWERNEPARTPRSPEGESPARSAEQAAFESSPLPASPASQPTEEAAQLKREAVTAARQVADAYPEDALTYALLGSASYNTGRSEDAIQYLRKSLELNPEMADAYEILARVAYEKGNPEESVGLYREALKRSPANAEVLNRLGRALLDLGQTGEALQTLQQAAQLPKPISESWYLLGQASLQSGSHAQAKDCFKRAIELLPDHTQAFFGLYTACLRLNQTVEAEEAREQFQKLEALDRGTLTDRSAQEDTLTGLPLVRKTVARTLFGAAQIHSVHKAPTKAAELFRRAAVLDADNAAYRAALEAHYVRSEALPEGVKAFAQLAAEQPGNELNHFFLGRLHARLGQVDAAERAFHKVQELAPDWPDGYRALIEAFLRANRKPAEARALARRLVELQPIGPHYYLLALACLQNQDRTGALEAVTKAVDLDPGEERFRQLLRNLEQAP